MKDLAVGSNPLPPAFGGTQPSTRIELRSRIEQAKKAWLRKSESQKTRIAYGRDLDQFLEFLGLSTDDAERFATIVPSDVTAWRDHLLRRGGRSDANGNPLPAENSTVARKITSLRSFFSFLQNYGYRGANPAHPDFVTSPKVSGQGLTVAIDTKQMDALLEAPDVSTPIGIRDRAILSMFAFMALRVDELHNVNVGSIARDGEHTVVRIKGKGNDLRKGVMPPVASNAVNRWIETAGIREENRGPLFRPSRSPRGAGRNGFKRDRLSIRPIQRLLKKYCLEAGIGSEVSVHSLRVTCATQVDRAGVPLIDIQHWLGHRDPRTTLRYIRGRERLDRSPAYAIRYG